MLPAGGSRPFTVRVADMGVCDWKAQPRTIFTHRFSLPSFRRHLFLQLCISLVKSDGGSKYFRTAYECTLCILYTGKLLQCSLIKHQLRISTPIEFGI